MAGLVPDNAPKTLAEQIVKKIMADVKDMLREDDNTPIFKTVLRGDPDEEGDLKPMQLPACFIEDSDDPVGSALYTQDVIERELALIVHVRFMKGQQGFDPYEVFQYYRGRLTAMFGEPNYIRPLGTIMYEVGSSPEVFGSISQQGGNISFRVKYRHERNNPYVAR